MTTLEANFDGLVGPTHNYAGLSYGNQASKRHGGKVSAPKAAALQGIAKMRALVALGLPQGVLPPQERPNVGALRRLGFSGSDRDVIACAHAVTPALLAMASSASAMWAANAATVAPSADTADGKVHLTPANLVSTAHRSFEPEETRRALGRIFGDSRCFTVHPPLPGGPSFGDEGAANHTRLGASFDRPGVHLFVYGRAALGESSAPRRYPARQTLEASEAVARLHRLDSSRTVFAQQAPEAIDAGVFHNDVAAVGHESVLFFHEQAFADSAGLLEALGERVEGFTALKVPADAVSLEDAVNSYLFNAQLLRPPGHEGLVLLAPEECRETESVRRFLDANIGSGPIGEVRYLDLRQSMQNGGGPACLRLRVILSEAERQAVHAPIWMTPARLDALEAWVKRHYRDQLAPDDLADPALLEESRSALDALTELLELGDDFYPFQRTA